MNKRISACIILLISLCGITLCQINSTTLSRAQAAESDYIKWVDFNVSHEILREAHALDKKYHSKEINGKCFDIIEVLAYLALKNGNDFSNPLADKKRLHALIQTMEREGKSAKDIYGENKYFKYYLAAFEAVLGGFFGEYTTQSGEQAYGLIAYSPIAKGYWYGDYDDFGNRRSYGYKRKHLGHDLMGSTGTPVIAIEGGRIRELGWNQYGGWRVGIDSFDGKRYYYYAHLRKDKPFKAGLKVGDTVNAGEVIGYMGMTGYSRKENVNMTSGKPHLHLGLQLIFDESQREGSKEIWIDLYAITRFLSLNKATVVKDPQTKEFSSVDLRMGKN